MRLLLQLHTTHKPALLPFNYQYPLSSAIYKIIQRADAGFAGFLHERGYGEGYKQFKLFTFSDISTRFVRNGDRMVLQTGEAQLIVCFYLPEAAENFVKGLFMNQQLEIADSVSKTVFRISQVEMLADKTGTDAKNDLVLEPLSPIVTGRKNEKGHYDFRSPEDADFTDCILHNWLEKYRAVYHADESIIQEIKEQIKIKVQWYSHPPKKRLVTIKEGTVEETRIRGYTKFRLLVTAPAEMLELAMGAGLGLYNGQGMGCVGVG
jgi:CRISPR-associated endoribonuclease Cas6